MSNPNARRVPYSATAYNAAAARYIDPKSGRFMSGAKVRAIVDAEIAVTGPRMVSRGDTLKTAASAFKAGSISQDEYSQKVREWRDVMAADVKAAQFANRAAGVGGFHAVTKQDHSSLGGDLAVQFRYLNNFAIEAAANPDLVLSQAADKQDFDRRVLAYAEAARNSFEKGQKASHERAGFSFMENDEELNAHHCAGANSCPEHTAMGRVAINDSRFKLPGARRCGPKCKCRTLFFKEAV